MSECGPTGRLSDEAGNVGRSPLLRGPWGGAGPKDPSPHRCGPNRQGCCMAMKINSKGTHGWAHQQLESQGLNLIKRGLGTPSKGADFFSGGTDRPPRGGRGRAGGQFQRAKLQKPVFSLSPGKSGNQWLHSDGHSDPSLRRGRPVFPTDGMSEPNGRPASNKNGASKKCSRKGGNGWGT